MSSAAPQVVVDTPQYSLSVRLSDYGQMLRLRIIVMSAVAVAAGFTLASQVSVNFSLLGQAVFGICCLVAASSVLNQVIEASSDQRMSRTEARPLASGRISAVEGSLLGVLLATAGTIVLWLQVNQLTAVASLLTMLSYVLIYTPLKRLTVFCTTAGAVPGAMPAVLGWFAAGGALGTEAFALFAIFFVWQFPHFLAIGWLHRRDYEQAGLLMLPSFSDGGFRAGMLALLYAVAFMPVTQVPRYCGLAGDGYSIAAFVLSTGYLWLTLRFSRSRTDGNARKLMAGSLICLPVLLFCLVFDYLRLTA